jgi:hypothetical protein
LRNLSENWSSPNLDGQFNFPLIKIISPEFCLIPPGGRRLEEDPKEQRRNNWFAAMLARFSSLSHRGGHNTLLNNNKTGRLTLNIGQFKPSRSFNGKYKESPLHVVPKDHGKYGVMFHDPEYGKEKNVLETG